jgi:hypothetical protein
VAHKECSKAVDISAANTFLFITAPPQLVGVKLNNNWHGTEKGQMKKLPAVLCGPSSDQHHLDGAICVDLYWRPEQGAASVAS